MKKQQPGASSPSDLCDRFTQLEDLVRQHSHELAIQFDRIAQIQAEIDKLGFRRDKSLRDSQGEASDMTNRSTKATEQITQKDSSSASAHENGGSTIAAPDSSNKEGSS